MVQVARLAPGHWRLPEVRSQKMPVREQALRSVALAPGSRLFPEPVEWAGETQKRVLLRAQAERRAPLFPGDLAWPLPTWARRTLRVRVMGVPGILVGARMQTQRLHLIEQAQVEAWQPVVEQAAQLTQCEQELFLRRPPFEEKLPFARELRCGQQRSCLNRRSRSCRHRSEPWRRQTRKPGW